LAIFSILGFECKTRRKEKILPFLRKTNIFPVFAIKLGRFILQAKFFIFYKERKLSCKKSENEKKLVELTPNTKIGLLLVLLGFTHSISRKKPFNKQLFCHLLQKNAVKQ
jgi:hypothetical protein